MTTGLKITLAFLTTALAAYLFVIYVLPFLPIGITVIYFVIAAYQAATSLYMIYQAIRPQTALEGFFKDVREQNQTTFKRVSQYANTVGAILRIISIALMWPLPIIFAVATRLDFRAKTARGLVVRNALILTEPWEAFATFLLVMLGVALVAWGFRENWYLQLFLIVILFNLTVRLLGLSLVEGGLPLALRRKTLHPYKIFALMAAIDLLSLVLGFYVFRIHPDGSLFSGSEFIRTIMTILFPRHLVSTIISGTPFQNIDLLSGAAGFVYYITISKNLLSIKNFKRTVSDYLFLANLEILQGRFSAALRTIGNVPSEAKTSTDVLLTKAVGLIGVEQFDEAKRLLEGIMVNSEAKRRALSEDAIVSFMGTYVATVPIDPEGIARFLQWASELGASEWIIVSIFLLVTQRDLDIGRGVAETIIRKTATIKRRLPMLVSVAYLQLHDLENAKLALAEVQSNHPLQDLMTSYLRIMMDIIAPDTSEEQDRVTFSNWIDVNIPKIQHEIDELSGLQEKVAALGILTPLRFLAKRFNNLSADESLSYLADKIVQELNIEKETRGLAPALEKLVAA